MSQCERLGKKLEVCYPSTEFKSEALVIVFPNDHKKFISPQSSLSGISQKTTVFTEVEISLHVCNTSLNDEMETQIACSSAPSTVQNGSKFPQRNKTCEPDSSKCPKR